MAILSAFADEIDADPKVQMDVLDKHGIKHIELRAAWNTNIMKLTDDQVKQLKTMFDDRGFAIGCIASPIGKVTVDSDLDKHFGEFRHACDLAEFFECGRVRMFSFYPPQGGNILDYRDTVIARLQQMCDHVATRPVTMVLENESRLYGSLPPQIEDLFESLTSDKLIMAFDPANFVNDGALPVFETCWEPLKKYVGYFHIKDMVRGKSERCVPAGEGDGDMEKVLAGAAGMGYDGFLALEPHLEAAGQFAGQTGPELFGKAVSALKRICDRVGLSY